MFARQFTASPTSYCDVDWNSFFNRFVVNNTTSVVSQKHWHAAKYPMRLCANLGCDIVSTIAKEAQETSYPSICRYVSFRTAWAFTNGSTFFNSLLHSAIAVDTNAAGSRLWARMPLTRSWRDFSNMVYGCVASRVDRSVAAASRRPPAVLPWKKLRRLAATACECVLPSGSDSDAHVCSADSTVLRSLAPQQQACAAPAPGLLVSYCR